MVVHNRIVAKISLGLILLNSAATAHAIEIHKWIDEDGVTHYSENQPSDDEIVTEKLELPDVYGTEPQESDDGYYSVVNQASRLEASRLAREDERRKDREQDLQEQALAAQQTPEVVNTHQDNGRYYPVFFQNGRVRQFDNPYDFRGRHGRYPNDNYYPGKDQHRSPSDRSNRRDSPAFDSSLFEKQ